MPTTRSRGSKRRAAAAGAAAGGPVDSLLSQALRLPALQDALLSLNRAGSLLEASQAVASLGLAGAAAAAGVNLAALWQRLEAHADVAGAAGACDNLPHSLGEGGLAAWKAKGLQALCRALTLPTTGGKPALQERLSLLEPLLPRHVPLTVVLATKRQAAEVELEAAEEEAAAEARPERITASTARSEFLLRDAELADIDCHLAPNPHYSSAAPMRLYCRSVVEALATWVHGGFPEVLDIKRRLAGQRRQNRIAAAESRDQQRRAELTAALAERGLELRFDSRLCHQYLTTGQPALEYVVLVMEQMRFYFEHTQYDEIRERLQEEYRENEEYYDLDELSDEAKHKALKKWARKHTLEECLAAAPESMHASIRQLKR